MKEKVKKTLLEIAEQNSFPSKINIQSIIENKKRNGNVWGIFYLH